MEAALISQCISGALERERSAGNPSPSILTQSHSHHPTPCCPPPLLPPFPWLSIPSPHPISLPGEAPQPPLGHSWLSWEVGSRAGREGNREVLQSACIVTSLGSRSSVLLTPFRWQGSRFSFSPSLATLPPADVSPPPLLLWVWGGGLSLPARGRRGHQTPHHPRKEGCWPSGVPRDQVVGGGGLMMAAGKGKRLHVGRSGGERREPLISRAGGTRRATISTLPTSRGWGFLSACLPSERRGPSA